MRNKLLASGALERREAEKPCMIAHSGRRFSLLHRLLSAADQPGDHRERPVAPGLRSLDRGLKNRLIQTRLANFKLRRMHSNGHTTGSGIDVVASQRPLATLIKLALGRQRQRMSRYDGASLEDVVDRYRNCRTMEPHGRALANSFQLRLWRQIAEYDIDNVAPTRFSSFFRLQINAKDA
jgi:hypothetical protein